MPLIKAFRGLRPVASRAAEVVAPPYDVVSAAEARELVAGRPWSFLHISRPEVDLPQDVDPYAPEVYAKAAENLQHMLAEGVLVRDPSDCYYVYRLTMGEHVQTGLVAAASVAAYDVDRIRKHEFTRPVKEDDRVRQIEALNAQTGPVFLVYRAERSVDSLLSQVAGTVPDVDVTAGDGVKHQLWVVDDSEVIERLTESFDAMDALYVADGHHRSAAASRVAGARNRSAGHHRAEESHDYFLSVVFPHDQMQILDYNRLIRDLRGESVEEFLAHLEARFQVEPSEQPVRPARSAEFGMYLDGGWYRLVLDPERVPWDDPVARLDVSLLANELIQPLLGIKDPRRDDRIDFVGGIRGLRELERRVDSGDWAVAFSLYPTRMEDLMAVADAGEVMPPKSTWFEPKLADGLVSHVLD
jgi:uncharacterized protein (DUF1015 family)